MPGRRHPRGRGRAVSGPVCPGVDRAEVIIGSRRGRYRKKPSGASPVLHGTQTISEHGAAPVPIAPCASQGEDWHNEANTRGPRQQPSRGGLWGSSGVDRQHVV